MEITKQVLELFLLSKSILDRTRFQPSGEPSRHALALEILESHDAAELALAGICNALNKLPSRDKHYLMDYFEPLKAEHSDREVYGKGYFNQLNRLRTDIKHYGIIPDSKQWKHVSNAVHDYISQWCMDYLGLAFDDLDESVLLENEKVKTYYAGARELASQSQHQQALEKLALGLHEILRSNSALRTLNVGRSSAEDAIRVATFGVQANDFLTLQQFLPQIYLQDEQPSPHWVQKRFGHPGNWRADTVAFCLRAFLDVALKLQNLEWIPAPMAFYMIYEVKITVLKDQVEMWSLRRGESTALLVSGKILQRELVKTFHKGDTLRGIVTIEKDSLSQSQPPPPPEIHIWCDSQKLSGYFSREDVKVTCVPREFDWVQKYFPGLPEIDWDDSE